MLPVTAFQLHDNHTTKLLICKGYEHNLVHAFFKCFAPRTLKFEDTEYSGGRKR
jgi:hypothetical protein